MAMTPTKILLAGAAMVSLLIMFATRPASVPPQETVAHAIPTEAILQPPFDTPSWVPDQATKKKALKMAYDITGTMNAYDGMSEYFSTHGPGSIDLSHVDFTERVTSPRDVPTFAAVEAVDPNARNALDMQAGVHPDWEGRRRFMNRTFRATRDQLAHHDEDKPKDVCKIHKMRKVQIHGGKSWRCER